MQQPPISDAEFSLALLSHLPEAVIAVDQAGHLLFCNAAAERLLPGGIAGLFGGEDEAATYRVLSRHQHPLVRADMPLARVLSGQHLQDEELLLSVGVPPHLHWLALTSCPFSLPGQPGAVLLTLRDISAAKQRETALLEQGLWDGVTGLPNRLLLLDRLNHALALAQGQPHGLMALLSIALSGLKTAGPSTVAEVGNRLQAQIGPADTLARLNEQEFVVLLENLSTSTTALDLAEQIHAVVTQPGLPEAIALEARIGIALGPAHYRTADDWLRDAATAAHQISSGADPAWQVFDNSQWVQQDLKLQTELDLRQAISQNELRLHYQPIVTISNQDICGFEALVRWQHPTRGLLMPVDFINIAETTGLIVPLGWWVMAEACRQMQAWTEQYPAMASFTVSVNMSSKQFAQPHLVEDIQQLLVETGFAANRLKIEITEGVLIDHSDSIIATLEQLKAMGIKLLVDDFGTGYSSLSYLHRFPFDCLKIDRSFIENADQDFEKLEILQSVVRLAWNLGLDVVAEGIETPRHHAQLKALRCELGQGYLFSRPLPPDGVEAMMAEKNLGAERPAADSALAPSQGPVTL
jgi:EAL domain-containing protein (putative c-di-GMP-specific phosphodiesterase class I)/GGDEF domain-containing protein